ncbi:MAG: glycosyl hydrolase, partial [Sporomusaceae bacterium]|nr:glycosyl hydrolase [Sporomusaceae bacterium]
MKIRLQTIAFCLASLAFLSAWLPSAEAAESTTSSSSTTAPTYIVNGEKADADPQLPYEDLKKIESYSPWYNRYTDYTGGYMICFPRDMQIDASLSAVRTTFSNATTQIEVYADKLDGDPQSGAAYLTDSNKFAENQNDHGILADSRFALNGFQVRLLKWTRHRLKTVTEDKNNYVSIELVKNNRDAFTVLIKSSEPIVNEMQILNSFQTVAKKGIAGVYQHYKPTPKTPVNEETKQFAKKYLADSSPQRWGMYEANAPEEFGYLTGLEEELRYSFPVLIRYQTFDETFPVKSLQNAYDHKKIIELSLQTFHYNDDNSSVLYEILDGRYDDYFNTYAQSVKKFGHPILLRLDNEMNGRWCPYSSFFFSKDPELFKLVWRHIHDIFTKNGVNNVLWVWNPNDESFPKANWNNYLNYYPGDAYVDVVGLTGYNTGTSLPGEKWREFNTIYRPL